MTPPNPNKPSDLVHESELRTEDLNVNISTLSSSRAAPLPDKYIEQMFSLGHGLPLRRAIFDKSAVERIEVGTAVALLANGCPRRMDVSSAGESAYRIATSTGVHRADEAGRCGTSTEQSNVSVLWGPGLKGTDITDKDSERAYIRQFNLTMEGDTSGFLILESADNTAMTDKTPALTTMTEYLHALGKGRDGCANAEMLVLVTGTTKATAFYGATVQRLPEQNPQDSATKELFVMLDGLGDYTCDVSGVRLVRHHYACTDRSVLPKPAMHTLFVHFLVIKVRNQPSKSTHEVIQNSATRDKPRKADPTYLELVTVTSDFVKPLLQYILDNAPSATAAVASDADVEALFEGQILTDLSPAALQQQLETCKPEIVVETVGRYQIGRLEHAKTDSHVLMMDALQVSEGAQCERSTEDETGGYSDTHLVLLHEM